MSLLEQFGIDATARVDNACKALAEGRGVVLIDDEDRENEGDLIFAASSLTVADVVRMLRDCSGIICLCLTEAKAKQLALSYMVDNNTSQYQTAFTVSIEAKEGVTTGVSAHDRWQTIHTAIKPQAKASEGSVDLLKLAQLEPSAVLCELMNPDGTMQKLPQLIQYAKENQFPLLTVEDIYQYRMQP